MKYFAALPLAFSLAAATTHAPAQEMQPAHTYVMSAGGGEAQAHATAAAEGGATHTVIVGGVKPVETGMAPVLLYQPEAITANIGDRVKFVFMQKNHTATQSTFDEPCKAMEGGLDSGFKANPMGETGPDFEWEMTVETEEPLWFYCKQRNGIHCGKGMVFSINAKTEGDKTMANFKQLAIQKNGTEFATAPIQSVNPTEQAAASTVTVIAGDGGAAATATGGGAHATVVPGQGVDGNGDACACSCLCGMNAFPNEAPVNGFGGFAGVFPS